MGKVFDELNEPLTTWLLQQHVFFVASAPSSSDGHVNCSPKGLAGCFAVTGPREVAYLDLTGSGAETIAHVRENGRIVLMFCAFAGRPRIVRLHGHAEIITLEDPRYPDLVERFTYYEGARCVIRVQVSRIADSCGYGVPRLDFVDDRPQLPLDHAKRGPSGLAEYRRHMNSQSIDGLPGL